MGKLFFRFHRGGFKESMETMKAFNCLKDVFEYVLKKYTLCEYISDISVSSYGYDDRLSAETFIVCVKNRPCGFLWYENNQF